MRSERFYPFDSYRLMLDPIGCVGSVVPNCFNSGNVALRTLTVELAAGQFFEIHEDDDSQKVVRIARPFFVRWVSVWSDGISLAFLIYLLFFVKETDELLPKALGYFAALWGLAS